MSDAFNNSFDAETSTFNTGPGTQNIYQNFYASERASREFRSKPLALDLLVALKRRFQSPDGMADVRRTLEKAHTVLIDGEPGSGRNAAARMLLYEYSSLHGNLHEVLPEDAAGNVGLDSRPAGEAEGLLLDLSETDGKSWHTIHQSLGGFHNQVRESGSRLVVVLPNPIPGRLHSDLNPLRAMIYRPSGQRVLRGALREARLPDDEELPMRVQQFLGSRPPLDQVVYLAWLIRTASDKSPSGKFVEWCETAVDASTRRPDEVALDVVALEGGRPRALMLATAMLHGARSDAVYEACESLLSTVGHPEDERPLLEREDLSSGFSKINAIPDKQGRVTFTAMDYDSAIRTHFWNNMPGLRSQLGAWGRETVTLGSLTPEDRLRLADRLAEQTLRTGSEEDLLAHIRAWADHGGRRAQPAAWQALTYGALHPDHGRRFREELYNWAMTARLSDGRVEALIAVCSGQFASRYPESAMVRLHQMARRHARGREAESQLARLILPDPRLHRRMLERLARGLEKWRADVRLFTVLASPRHLTTLRSGPDTSPQAPLGDRSVRERLTACWAVLFECVPQTEWLELSDQWLLAADYATPLQRNQLIDIIVRACGRQPRHLGLLYHVAFPHRVAPLVKQKIDAVQGI